MDRSPSPSFRLELMTAATAALALLAAAVQPEELLLDAGAVQALPAMWSSANHQEEKS